ncbi:hypothetical protein GCM10027614_14940 [Micromonospora vulcania]
MPPPATVPRMSTSDPRPVGLAALLPYLREHRGTLAVVGVLSLAGAGASLAQPLLTRSVLDRVSAAGEVSALVAVLVVLVVLGAAIGGLRDYLLQRTAEGLVLGTRRRLAGHLLRLPIAEYDARRTGDLLSRVGSDTTLLRAVVTSGLFETVTGAVMVLGAGTAMVLLDPLLFGVTLLGVGLGLGFAATFARRVRALARAAQERIGEMTSAVERAISAARTIRASRAETREADAVTGSAREAYAAGLRVARVQAVVGPVGSVTVQGAFLLVLGIGGAGWPPARSPSVTWSPSSCTCSSWPCRWPRCCGRTPSCRPAWARCSGSRRSSPCPRRARRTGRRRPPPRRPRAAVFR